MELFQVHVIDYVDDYTFFFLSTDAYLQSTFFLEVCRALLCKFHTSTDARRKHFIRADYLPLRHGTRVGDIIAGVSSQNSQAKSFILLNSGHT